MKYPLLLLAGLLSGSLLSAQYHRSIEVKAGEDVAKAYSPSGFYRFPEFSNGTLYSRLRSGNSAQLFNYNVLYDKVQFINHNDTMEMMNPTLFDSIVINNRVFYYREGIGYLELIAAAYPLRLVRKTIIKLKPLTVGAYDGTTTTSAINKINNYTVWPNVYTFKENEDLAIKESIDWYWTDGKGDLKKATRKNLWYMLPPAKQKTADVFIKQNKTNFDNEASLVELLKVLQ